ncbi:MAG: c-type cytochrome [Gammaproteobacteria bacterium]
MPIGDVSVAGVVEESEAMPSNGGETMAAAGDTTGNKGKEVYGGLCVSCHGSGIPGIPQFGDTAAWGPRIAQGKDTLYKNSLQGYTGKSGMMMPPKGGNPALSDDDVKSAVDYMVANSQ